MSIVLAENEKLVKSWTYSMSKRTGSDAVIKSVSVTDKRVISEILTKHAISHVEISNKDIEEVEGLYAQQRKMSLLVSAIIGVIAAVVGLVIKTSPLTIAGLVWAGIFILLFLVIKRCCMNVVIRKRIPEIPVFGINEGLKAQDNARPSLFRRRKNNRQIRVVVKIDPNVAKDIVESISDYLNM